MNKKAVVLLSGGLDSSTSLAVAKRDGFDCYALSFNYGQRHKVELDSARQVGEHFGIQKHIIVNFDLTQFGGSALTDTELEVPEMRSLDQMVAEIPITYVPGRNTILLAYGLSYAEVINADAIYAGVNALDYSGYPDCRPEYIEAYQKMADIATRKTVEGSTIQIVTPLIDLSKVEIIKLGHELGVDFSMTSSCYNPSHDGKACGKCDSCILRREGFEKAGLPDPTRYQEAAA